MKLYNISKIYTNKNNQVQALKEINLEIENKGITVLLGPSGCGKTTLLNIISGKDKDFNGELKDIPACDYVTQDILLFENMSVLDNLKIICPDDTRIEEWLRKLEMWEHKDKKVRKCSQGQKKRVQLIRSFLLKTKLILCDEPSASLDFENANLIMECLKEYANDSQVVVVTHDIALAETYANRIITMDQGIIVNDTGERTSDEIKNENRIPKKDFKETLQLVFFEIKSSFFDYSFKALLSLVCILCLFVSVDGYKNIKTQTDILSIYNESKNIVVSQPNTYRPRTDDEPSLFKFVYDVESVYSFDAIQETIQNHPEIMAVQSFYSLQYVIEPNIRYYLEKEALNNFNTFTIDGVTAVDGSLKIQADIPMNLPFLLPENFNELDSFSYLQDVYYQNPISVYNLVNQHSVPLLVGQMPQNNEEAVISRTLADTCMQVYGINSYEELIGKMIHVGVEGYRNLYHDDVEEIEKVEDIGITISGISTIDNKDFSMMFFTSDYPANPINDHFIQNYQDNYFDFVHFMIDPEKDVNQLAQSIDQSLKSDDHVMQIYNGEGNKKVRFESPVAFMPYLLMSCFFIVIIILVTYIFDRKRMLKEDDIISQYGYSKQLSHLLMISFIMLPSFIVMILLGNNMIAFFNDCLTSLLYEPFIDYNLVLILLSFILTALIHGLISFFVSRKN